MWCEPGPSAGEATLDTESPNVLGTTTACGTTSPASVMGGAPFPRAAGDFQAGVRRVNMPAAGGGACFADSAEKQCPRAPGVTSKMCPQRPRSRTAGQHARADSGPHRSVTASGDVQQQSPIQGPCGHLLSRALGMLASPGEGGCPSSCRVKCSDSVFTQQCWAPKCPHLGDVLQRGRRQTASQPPVGCTWRWATVRQGLPSASILYIKGGGRPEAMPGTRNPGTCDQLVTVCVLKRLVDTGDVMTVTRSTWVRGFAQLVEPDAGQSSSRGCPHPPRPRSSAPLYTY